VETMDSLKAAADLERQNGIARSRAYSYTLSALAPANFVLVVGAALLALVAGASILTKYHLLSESVAGELALLSSAFTIIHTKLGCESYQAECKRLSGFYRKIAEEYGSLKYIDEYGELKKQFLELNNKIVASYESAAASPFDWALRRAERDASK
jgi:hypothetical protein